MASRGPHSDVSGRKRDMPSSRQRDMPSGFKNGAVARVLIALPWIAFTVLVIAFGGWVFAVTVACFAVLALHELYVLMREYRPLILAGFLGSIALALVAKSYGPQQLMLVLAVTFVLIFLMAAVRRERAQVTASMAVTLFGVVWVGVALAHAVLLRELPHGGALLIGVLAATFVGDTAAYFGGSLYGRSQLATQISPNKTWEGLLFGIVGAIAAFWFVSLYHDWLSSAEAVVLGLGVAVVAPVGDLFESFVKRDLDVKDSGGFFGEHGGVLDRLDAVFFTVVVGYYLSKAILLV